MRAAAYRTRGVIKPGSAAQPASITSKVALVARQWRLASALAWVRRGVAVARGVRVGVGVIVGVIVGGGVFVTGRRRRDRCGGGAERAGSAPLVADAWASALASS